MHVCVIGRPVAKRQPDERRVIGERRLQLGDRYSSIGPQPAVAHPQTAHFLISDFGVTDA